jgi:hypothetical protein
MTGGGKCKRYTLRVPIDVLPRLAPYGLLVILARLSGEPKGPKLTARGKRPAVDSLKPFSSQHEYLKHLPHTRVSGLPCGPAFPQLSTGF